jgi:hypothetical protein
MERYEFDCDGDRLVGNLHLPQGDVHGVAILTGPLTSVKEQATGAWGSALAERGFVSLSFDHRYYGESGGRPRQLEKPAAKIADIQAAAASLHSDSALRASQCSLSASALAADTWRGQSRRSRYSAHLQGLRDTTPRQPSNLLTPLRRR